MVEFDNGKISCVDKNITAKFHSGSIEKNIFKKHTSNVGTLIFDNGYILTLFMPDSMEFASKIQGKQRTFICNLFNREKYVFEKCVLDDADDNFVVIKCEDYKKE